MFDFHVKYEMQQKFYILFLSKTQKNTAVDSIRWRNKIDWRLSQNLIRKNGYSF